MLGPMCAVFDEQLGPEEVDGGSIPSERCGMQLRGRREGIGVALFLHLVSDSGQARLSHPNHCH